jgi:hypothetical protein
MRFENPMWKKGLDLSFLILRLYNRVSELFWMCSGERKD